MAQVLSGDPRLTGALSGQGYGPLAPSGYTPIQIQNGVGGVLGSGMDPETLARMLQNAQAPDSLLTYLGVPGAVNDKIAQSNIANFGPGMVRSAVSAFTLPGDAVAGRVDPFSDEGIARGRDFAGMVTLGAGGVPAASNELGMGVRAAGKAGLPMNYASRMARANEQGFTTDVYHGTGSDIQQFENAKSVRSAYGVGTHVAEHPNLANVFASQFKEGGRVMPLRVDLGNVADGETFKKYAAQNDWNMQATTDDLRKAGYDSVKYEHGQYYNVVDGKLVAAKKGEDTAYAILDPKNIRSKAAAFDPKKRGSANIMHGLAGPIIGGAVIVGNQQQQPGT